MSSTLDLVSTLVNSRSRMVRVSFGTFESVVDTFFSLFLRRYDQIKRKISLPVQYVPCLHLPASEVVQRVRNMFNSRSRPTWITVEPLSFQAISSLVSKTMHRTKEDCVPLSRFIFAASSGNAFSARSVLTTLQRQRHVRPMSSKSLTGLRTSS